jgi:hypothetical protein
VEGWVLVFYGIFEGCFGKSGVQNVVFLWSSCGELRGKRGQITPLISATEKETPL